MTRPSETDLHVLRTCNDGDVCTVDGTVYLATERPGPMSESQFPCNYCAFLYSREESKGTELEQCPYITACMAHKRKDRKSVIFREVNVTIRERPRMGRRKK